MNRIPGLRLEELAEALSKLNIVTQQASLSFMRFDDSLFVQSTYVGPRSMRQAPARCTGLRMARLLASRLHDKSHLCPHPHPLVAFGNGLSQVRTNPRMTMRAGVGAFAHAVGATVDSTSTCQDSNDARRSWHMWQPTSPCIGIAPVPTSYGLPMSSFDAVGLNSIIFAKSSPASSLITLIR